MAYTFARTKTTTFTLTRIDLLVSQVRIAMRRTGLPAATIQKVVRGVQEKWIEKITICAEDGKGLIWCQLVLHIDWARHELHLVAGRTTVTYDDRWTEGTAIELDEALNLYNQYVRSQGNRLRPHLYVYYLRSVGRDQANRQLGFTPAAPKKWAGERGGTRMMIPELDEVTVEFEMVV